MQKVAFILAIHNEEKNIDSLYIEICKSIEKLNYQFEFLFVDDGSKDESVALIRNLMSKDKRVKLIKLTRNFGHQLALSAGMENTNADAVITMDTDLQDPPALIPKIIEEWQKGYKVVYAQRNNYRDDNYIKRIMTKSYYYLVYRVQGVKIPPNVGDFRLIDKTVKEDLVKFKERARYLRGMVAWLGYSASYVKYNRLNRSEGRSSYGFKKLFSLGMDGLISFSMLPLRFGLYLGVISIILGLGFFSYMVFDILVNNVYYHLYKFLVNVIFMFMGFMFILMWILGEYVGRIFSEAKNRPLYIVESKENFNEK